MNKFLLHFVLKPLGQSVLEASLPHSAVLAAGITAAGTVAASGLSAAAGNANSHQGRVFSRWAVNQSMEDAARARTWQSMENTAARQWEEKMYNEYNSPSAMMYQYKKAGLNPYLVGSGAVGQGMSQSAPMSAAPAHGSAVGAPPVSMPDFSPIASLGPRLVEMLGINANIANQEAKTAQTNWETYWQIRRDVGKDYADKWADNIGLFDNPRPGSSQSEELIASEVFRNDSQAALNRVQASFIENFDKPKAEKEINLLGKSLDELTEKINLLKSDQQLNEQKGRELGALIKQHYAEAFKAAEEAGTVRDMREHLVRQAALSAGMSATQFEEMMADYEGNSEVRTFKRSAKGKSTMKLNYVIDNNPAMRFTKGFAESLGSMVPNTIIPLR